MLKTKQREETNLPDSNHETSQWLEKRLRNIAWHLNSFCCNNKLCALAQRVWYLKLPTHCTRQTEPFMVWNEQSSSACLFCFAKRVRKNKKKKSDVAALSLSVKPTPLWLNWKQQQHHQQHTWTQSTNVFNIQLLSFYCSIVTVQYGRLSAAVSFFVSWAQSKHGISTVTRAEK